MKRTIPVLTALIALFCSPSPVVRALQQPPDPGAARRKPLTASAKARNQPVDAGTLVTIESLAADRSLNANPAAARMIAAWRDAREVLGPRAIVYLESRTGGPLNVQPDGLPWIPGTGMNNHLTAADLQRFRAGLSDLNDPRDPADGDGVNQRLLELIARDFMKQHPAWFLVPQSQLALQSGDPADPASPVRRVIFQQTVNGVVVEHASLVFHLSHGNLVSFGGHLLAPVTAATQPGITQDEARRAVILYTRISDPARLHFGKSGVKLVVADDGNTALGAGFSHRLVHEVRFRSDDEPGSWMAEVDALSGEVVRLVDSNLYGGIVGGVFPYSNDGMAPGGTEVANFPMPFADTGTPNIFTDTGGNYPQASGTVTTTLNGKYVKIISNPAGGQCTGTVSESVAAPGTMNLGTSGGTDCTVPAGKSAGDTHSARTAFYNVNKLKEEIRGWLPNNSFNNSQTPINVNLNQVCNAYWNGVSLNMFKSGSYLWLTCRNTGEIAGIFDHEYGHGMDGADGGPLSGFSEAYADITSSLHHHVSCIGRGFLQANLIGSTQCAGYGDACTNCTGVRDDDYTKHTSRNPATLNDIINGGRPYTCSAGTQNGPCGKETHCESYPIGETLWDMGTIDLPHVAPPANGGAACAGETNGSTPSQAWMLASRLWWTATGGFGDQYACTANGTAGCGATVLFENVKIADDDDGNLTNGTPHAAELQCAFNRHLTGCNTDNNVDFTTCPALAAPTLSLSGGCNAIIVNWTAVAGASAYQVQRNEEGCGAGYSVIATVSGSTLTYTDTSLQNGRTYYYQIQAVGSNPVCTGVPSSCQSLSPTAFTPPGAPTLGSVTPGNQQATVSWSNGAPVAAKFNIYRGVGTCASATLSRTQSGLSASPFIDAPISGQVTFAYKVTGTDATGTCESAQSGCLQVTPTGACTLPPNFAGITGAANTGTATCGNTLNWGAATANCTGAVTYNIYRSTAVGFTPSAANRIATGVSGTSYADSSGMLNGYTYYYVVRSVDSLGNEDGNTVKLSSRPFGPLGAGTFNETFEGPGLATDNPGWTIANTTAPNPWVLSTVRKHAGAASINDEDAQPQSDHSYQSPSLTLAAGSVLTFWHTWSFENGTNVVACGTGCYDGGVLEYKLGAGAWTRITQAQITGSTYNGSIDNNATPATNNPLGNQVPAWVGGTGTPPAFTQATVNIGTVAGAGSAQIRWRQGDDGGNGFPSAIGWWVDDVQITNLTGGVASACACGGAALTMSTLTGAKSGSDLVQNWPAVAGAASYNVYRNAAPANPGGWSTVQTGLTATTWPDAGQLGNTTSQFYLVTNLNGCGVESSHTGT